MKEFKTSFGHIIPSIKMNRMFDLLEDGMDWQRVIHEVELRNEIQNHENDLDEINEILAIVEEAIELEIFYDDLNYIQENKE